MKVNEMYSKIPKDLLPPNAKGCGSIKKAFTLLLESHPIEFGENHKYVLMCLKLGLDPMKATLAEMQAHITNMKGLSGDIQAIKFMQEATDGKVIAKLEAIDDPFEDMTMEQLKELEQKQLLIEGEADEDEPREN